MSSFLIPILAALVSAPPDDGIHDIRSLVAAIEALQRPIEDFRCEFEGAVVYKGALAEEWKANLDANGVFETFGGVFVWKREGEMFADILHNVGGDANAASEKIMIRPQERVFEHHNHPGGRSIGNVDIRNLDGIRISGYKTPASFFLIDDLKGIRDKDDRATTVTDEEVDGRPLKVLTVFMVFKGTDLPDRLFERYWIDLHRNGHAVRHETYLVDPLSSRSDITLKSFKIGKEDVWMPVASVSKTHIEDDAKGLSVYTREPTILQTMSIIDRTMEFNKHPGPDVFTSKYKPGTPISDHLKKLQYKYGQDKLKPQPTRSEVEAMLDSQLAKAETQKNELGAAPFSEGVNWWAWSVSGLGAAVVASLAALWMQRRAG
ncbi:hypothetical protein [Paludisphaera borealis]|uniref:Uncharacterized protein n=1 Tax=Paludisphaera borealis TaxID=1387353 RepID=A0A1U7CR97_9BACT|nr:hypothetical protein [Paludisphaera borealis]APW61419.1 hypothetical protein BSF38_02933 [Paludisphaera borealis]